MFAIVATDNKESPIAFISLSHCLLQEQKARNSLEISEAMHQNAEIELKSLRFVVISNFCDNFQRPSKIRRNAKARRQQKVEGRGRASAPKTCVRYLRIVLLCAL